ncbi:MAG: ABC transporter permease [Actinobacteria bacterium]|nr:ABC transporter permease [Actinomycetota bacterium]
MNDSIIEVENLTKKFGDFIAVDHISFTVKRGEVFGLPAQTIRGLIQAIIILLLSIFLFKVRVNGSIFLVFILILLGVLSFIGLGILLTSIARDQETASMLVSTFMFPMLLFSGVLFPTDQMPHFMQYISRILPLTYAVDALRRVMTIGVSLSVVSYDIIILLVFGIVTFAIAVPLFRKMMMR